MHSTTAQHTNISTIHVDKNMETKAPADAAGQRVLIVEDSIAENMRLNAMLTKLGYDVMSATNGQQALGVLDDHSIPLIISDWRMPEMSGIDLCRKVRDDARYGQPYFILLTGCDTHMDLVAGMEAGADDFITKPFKSEELRVRLQAGTRIVGLRDELEQRNVQLEQTLRNEENANRRIQEDLASAAAMQQALLPTGDSPFPQLEIATLFKPATMVAGDTYNYFRLDDDHLGFYHLDVSGHGIASAMLSFTLSRFLSPDALMQRAQTASPGATHPSAQSIAHPHDVVAALNQRFLEDDRCEHYFTMVYGVLNIITGEGELCQAGHPHPLHCHADGTITQVGNGGFPVGMLAEASYESTAFKLHAGERLWLYSDGIPDCSNETGKALGMEQFTSLLQHAGQTPLTRLPAAIEKVLMRWHGEKELDDDISLLAIGRIAQTNQEPAASKPIKLLIPANAIAVAEATSRVGKYCQQHALPTDVCFQVELIIAEALNNVVEHALDDTPNTKIEFKCCYAGNVLTIEIIDDGKPLNQLPSTKDMPELDAESGRGWPIIYSLADEVNLTREGGRNCLVVKKRANST